MGTRPTKSNFRQRGERLPFHISGSDCAGGVVLPFFDLRIYLPAVIYFVMLTVPAVGRTTSSRPARIGELIRPPVEACPVAPEIVLAQAVAAGLPGHHDAASGSVRIR